MLLSSVPLDDLNFSGLSSSPTTMVRWPPKSLDDIYEGLIGPICSDYRIINDDTFHPSDNENESNQSGLGARKVSEEEGNVSAVNLSHETTMKTHCATPFMPLQVKT